MNADEIVREVTDAWRDSTDWETFGREVGDILLANGINATDREDGSKR